MTPPASLAKTNPSANKRAQYRRMSQTAVQFAFQERGGQLSIAGVFALILAAPISAFGGLWRPLGPAGVVLAGFGLVLFLAGACAWNGKAATRSNVGEGEGEDLDAQR
ncbi:MAG: hypothetical protein ACLPUT_17370 [Solirubrobacteraceae bacterium]